MNSEEIKKFGASLGLTGQLLVEYVVKEQDKLREERKLERELEREKIQAGEKERERERQLELEKIQAGERERERQFELEIIKIKNAMVNLGIGNVRGATQFTTIGNYEDYHSSHEGRTIHSPLSFNDYNVRQPDTATIVEEKEDKPTGTLICKFGNSTPSTETDTIKTAIKHVTETEKLTSTDTELGTNKNNNNN